MRDNEFYSCSDLIWVSAPGTTEIANLEQISPSGCALTMPVALPVGNQVKMQCMECPQGKEVCTDCRLKGRVKSHEAVPLLGNLMEVDFEGRNWSAEEWRPRHLTRIGKGLERRPATGA